MACRLLNNHWHVNNSEESNINFQVIGPHCHTDCFNKLTAINTIYTVRCASQEGHTAPTNNLRHNSAYMLNVDLGSIVAFRNEKWRKKNKTKKIPNCFRNI